MLITRSYDDFDRAASADNLGAGWLDQRGAGLGVNNNQAYSAGGVRSSLSTTGNLSGDQWAEITIGGPGTTGGARGVGLVVRGSGTSGGGNESGYYFEVATDGSNSYRIYKIVGNTETVIRGSTTLPGAITAGATMRFEVEGSSLRAYVNDTLLTTETDTSLTTGRSGLLLRGDAPRANNFESGNFIDVPEYARVAADSDNFNRANGGLGSEWANTGTGLAGFQITGNQIVGTASAAPLMAQYTGDISSANQYASITITDIGTTGVARQLNPWVRINGTDTTRTGYGPNWRMDTGELFIARRNADQSETVLAEFGPRAPRVNDVLTTEVVTVNGGNLIRVYINNELIGSAFDTTPGYADGTTGLIGYRNTVRGDNFTTGILQAAGNPPGGPTLVADTGALTEDGASLVATGNVLDNDPAGLNVSAVRFGATDGTVGSGLQGAYGTLLLNANGSYTYSLANSSAAVQSLAAGATAQDTFTYAATGPGGTASTTLTFSVTGTNDAPVASATAVTTPEDRPVTGMLPTATDIDGDAVTYALATAAENGTVVIGANGNFTYTPDDNFTGADAFVYRVSDGRGGSNTYTATVTVTEDGGQPPSADLSVRATRAYDDFDRASVTDNLGGTWVDQRGAGLGVTNSQAYSAAGVRSSLSATGLQDDQWAETTIATLGTSGGARGVGLVVRGSGTSGGGNESGYYFEIATDGSNTYRIYKLVGNTETVIQGTTALPGAVNAGAQIRFEVEGSTLRAYLNNTLLTTETDTSLSTGRAGLLVRGTAPRANDFESGNFVDVPEYTRAPSFTDDFNRGNGGLGGPWIEAGEGGAAFRITGNELGGGNNDVSMMSQYTGDMSSPNQYASITITDLGTTQGARQMNPWVRIEGVVESRVGYGPNWRMDNGHLLVVRRDSGFSETVIAEFSPRAPRVGDVLTTEVISVAGGNLIRVYINNELMGSTLDSTPGFEEGTTGLIGFRNTVRGDNFTTGILQTNGPPPGPVPTPVADTGALTEDAANLVATGNVLDNDSPNGLSVSGVRFGSTNGTVGSGLQGAYGMLVLSATGDYTYSLANSSAAVQSLSAGQTAQDTFTYTARGPGGTASTTLTFTVTGANDAPVAAAVSLTTEEETPLTGALPVATDRDGDVITYALAGDAENGTVVVANDGTFTYTPDDNFNGTDAFSYRVSDGQGGSNTYTATVTVTDGDEPPPPDEDARVAVTRAYDDFDRAASAENLGTGWVDQRGAGLGVSNNQAYSAGDVRSSLSTTGNLPGDQWAEVTIGAQGAGGGERGVGLVVRGSGTSGAGNESGYYFEVLTDGSNSYRIYKLVGNTETVIQEATALPGALTAGAQMRFEVDGSTLRAYLNDTLLTTETDTSLTTGRAGLLLRGDAPRANDFESGNFIDVPDYTRVVSDTDSFNRANGGLGSEWVSAGTGLAGYQIAGNQIVGAAAATPTMSQYTGDIDSPNQFASITITDIGATGAARQLNPWVRINGSDTTRTGYGPNWRMDTGEIFIARRNANQSETVLAEFSPHAPRVNDVLTTEVITVAGGNLISIYINDELIGSALDNTPGYDDGTTGLSGYRNTVRGDNFSTGVLQVDGSPSLLRVADADSPALANDGASLVAPSKVVGAALAVVAVPVAADDGNDANGSPPAVPVVKAALPNDEVNLGQALAQNLTTHDADYDPFVVSPNHAWAYNAPNGDYVEALAFAQALFDAHEVPSIDGAVSVPVPVAVAAGLPVANPDPVDLVTLIGVPEHAPTVGFHA